MSLDWDLYRALYWATENPLWESVSHPNLATLAHEVGIGRNTVSRRLKEWRQLGFLRGYEFLPNPGLFGVGFLTIEVGHMNPGTPKEFLDQLENVDGVFRAFISVEDTTMIMCVADSRSSQQRRHALIAQLPGVESVGEPMPVWLPAPAGRLVASDWRFIAVLRESPDSPIAAQAARLGISTRTYSRRLRRLQAGHALLSVREVDFARFPRPVVRLIAELVSGSSARETADKISKRFPRILELASYRYPPHGHPERLGYAMEVENIPQVGDVEGELAQVPGIGRVRSTFPGSERPYRNWFDNRIEQVLKTEAGEDSARDHGMVRR